MAMFVVHKKYSRKEAEHAYYGIKEWFKNNPKRRVCRTEDFSVTRKTLKEVILSRSMPTVILED